MTALRVRLVFFNARSGYYLYRGLNVKRKVRKENTRKKVFKAALELFANEGFEKTTIEDITKKADVAKGTFYNFFSKKEDV